MNNGSRRTGRLDSFRYGGLTDILSVCFFEGASLASPEILGTVDRFTSDVRVSRRTESIALCSKHVPLAVDAKSYRASRWTGVRYISQGRRDDSR